MFLSIKKPLPNSLSVLSNLLIHSTCTTHFSILSFSLSVITYYSPQSLKWTSHLQIQQNNYRFPVTLVFQVLLLALLDN